MRSRIRCLILVGGLLTVGACAAPGPRIHDQRFAAAFEISSPRGACPAFDVSRGPAEEELPQFMTRVNGGFVMQPLDVRCISRAYGAETAVWARRHDPVAAYAALYSETVSRRDDVCLRKEEIVARLDAIYAMSTRYTLPSVKSRVPEAAYAAAEVLRLCGDARFEARMANLSDRGLSLYAMLVGAE